MKTLQITISEELAARLEVAAAKHGKTALLFAAEALERAMQGEPDTEYASGLDAPKSLGDQLKGLTGLVDSRKPKTSER